MLATASNLPITGRIALRLQSTESSCHARTAVAPPAPGSSSPASASSAPTASAARRSPARCRAGRSGISALATARRPADAEDLRRRARCSASSPQSVMDPAELRRVPRMVPMALAASREALRAGGPRHRRRTTSTPSARSASPSAPAAGGWRSSRSSTAQFFTDGQAVALLHHRRHARQPLQRAVDRPAPPRPVARALHRLHQQHRRDRLRDDAHPRRRRPDDARRRRRRADLAGHPARRSRRCASISTRRWDDPAQSSPAVLRRPRRVRARRGGVDVRAGRPRARRSPAARRSWRSWPATRSTCDAFHRVQIAPDVVEPVRAMELALADAGVAKDEVGYVNLHGTGTELNDRMETLAHAAAASATAPTAIPMSSTKSMIGHPQGACGAAGLAATVLGMREGVAAPDDQPRQARPRVRPRLHPATSRGARTSTSRCATASRSAARTARWSSGGATPPGRHPREVNGRLRGLWIAPGRASASHPRCRPSTSLRGRSPRRSR